jgi:hypothetical protein
MAIPLSVRKAFMSATQGRSEATLDRNQRREAEINEALKQEAARHAAAIKNMHRLRALRLAKDGLAQEGLAQEDKANHEAVPSKKPTKKAK